MATTLDENQIRKVREKVNKALVDNIFNILKEAGVDDKNLSIVLQCDMKRINDLRNCRDFIYGYEIQLIFEFLTYLSEKDDETWQAGNAEEDKEEA